MKTKRNLGVISLFGCFLLLAALLPAQIQQSSGGKIHTYPANIQQQAANMLESPMVKYLSGPAHTMLMHLSGRVTVPQMPAAPVTVVDAVHAGPGSSAGQRPRTGL